jgi:hypothetical protein
MHHIKKTAILQGCLMMFTNGPTWLKLGYKFVSAKAKTLMNRMMANYEPFTPCLHQRPSTEALVITCPPHQSATGVSRARFGVPLQTPKLQPMQPGSLQKNLTPSLLIASMVSSAAVSGGKTQMYLSQRFNKTGITCVR